MTGGSEGSFGNRGGPPFPADPAEDERVASFHDGEPDESTGDAVRGPFDSSLDDIEIPRHSMPFRKWSAAYGYSDTPSLWERFREWLSSLFRRKKEGNADQTEYADHADQTEQIEQAKQPGTFADQVQVTEVSAGRKSHELPHSDDFDAPWGDSPVASSAPAEATEFDEPMPPVAAPFSTPTAPDPLWDEPRVAASANAPAEVINRSDLDFVWSPPGTDDVDLLAESRAATASSEPTSGATAAPKRMSFISRLLSRKKKDKQAAGASEFHAPVDEEQSAPTDSRWVDESVRAQAPAVDDFAAGEVDDTLAVVELEVDPAIQPSASPTAVDVIDLIDVAIDSEVIAAAPLPAPPKRPSLIQRIFGRKSKEDLAPETELDSAIADLDVVLPMAETSSSAAEPAIEDLSDEDLSGDHADDAVADEPTIHSARRPSLAHSAEDAAQLADFLSRPAERIPEPEVDDQPTVDLTFIEAEARTVEEPPAPEPEMAEPELDLVAESFAEAETQTVDEAPAREPEAAEPEPAPAPALGQKKGFFSRLMWRRSQAKPLQVEPSAPPAADVAADSEIVDESLPDISADEEVERLEAVASDEGDAARWAPPEEKGEVAATRFDVTTPTPFVPFKDARDDFGDEPVDAAPPSVESGRVTEAVELPVVDPFAEGEKTDEFEVVPGVPADMAETATLAQAPGFFHRLFGRKPAATGETTAEGAPPTVAAVDLEAKAPFVLAKFRMFYNEVIRDKHQKSDVISGFATAIVSAAAADMADPEFAAQLLSKRLSEMLELQAAESNWTGGDAVKYYPDAQYAMVALADETFSTIEWPGRPSWPKYKLEPRMYGTRAADTEFFRRVDKLLREPDPPQGARDLARVYLLVIASGFRGLFREPGLKRPLAEYRRRLYEFSHLSDPLELYGRDRRIFPDAASRTLASRAVGRFTPAQKWIAAVVILSVLYATVSRVAWTRLSADLSDVMSRIESSTPPGGTAR